MTRVPEGKGFVCRGGMWYVGNSPLRTERKAGGRRKTEFGRDRDEGADGRADASSENYPHVIERQREIKKKEKGKSHPTSPWPVCRISNKDTSIESMESVALPH